MVGEAQGVQGSPTPINLSSQTHSDFHVMVIARGTHYNTFGCGVSVSADYMLEVSFIWTLLGDIQMKPWYV